MFELKENDFLKKGVCKYADEFNNRAVLRRNDKGFSAKLWLADDRVKTKPMQINLFQKGNQEEGGYLYLESSVPNLKNEDFVTVGAVNFTGLINHWIEMLHDIAFLGLNNDMLKVLYAGTQDTEVTDEDCALGKLQRLQLHEELKPLLESVFGENKMES